MQTIYVRSQAVIVACGVARLADAAAHTSAIIVGVLANGTRTGMRALLNGKARQRAAAPKHTATLLVATALVSLSDKLRAIAIIDGPNTTDEAVREHRENFGSKRVFLVDPGVQSWDTALSVNVDAPGSALVAGLFA